MDKKELLKEFIKQRFEWDESWPNGCVYIHSPVAHGNLEEDIQDYLDGKYLASFVDNIFKEFQRKPEETYEEGD